jgi:hypothetical protein
MQTRVVLRFTGKLDKLSTIKLVPPKITAEKEKLLEQKAREARARAQQSAQFG